MCWAVLVFKMSLSNHLPGSKECSRIEVRITYTQTCIFSFSIGSYGASNSCISTHTWHSDTPPSWLLAQPPRQDLETQMPNFQVVIKFGASAASSNPGEPVDDGLASGREGAAGLPRFLDSALAANLIMP